MSDAAAAHGDAIAAPKIANQDQGTVLPVLAAEELALKDIVWNPELHIRSRISRERVQKLTTAYRQGEPVPPLLVALAVDGYVLLDGFHRYAAAIAAGVRRVPCQVTATAEPRLWPWLAAQANLQRGNPPLGSREYREVFRRFVRAGEHCEGTAGGGFMTFREMAMAALAGARDAHTISNWMKADFPDIYAAICSGELLASTIATSVRGDIGRTGSAVDVHLAFEAVEKAGACARELASVADRRRVAQALRVLADELSRVSEVRDHGS